VRTQPTDKQRRASEIKKRNASENAQKNRKLGRKLKSKCK
jgi:hypothetical protein